MELVIQSQPSFLDKYSGLIAMAILIVCLIIFVKWKTNQPEEDEEEQEVVENKATSEVYQPLNLNDEDATVAALIASIECRKQYGKNVKVISVKEV